jgi:hypothetical protein
MIELVFYSSRISMTLDGFALHSNVMFVHFVVVELLQETKTLWTFWALVDSVSEVNFQMLHVVAFLLV